MEHERGQDRIGQELAVGRPSRRTVVRTAVWTAPALAVVTTAPAFAGTGCALAAFSFTDPHAGDPDASGRSGLFGVNVTSGTLPAGATLTISFTPAPGWVAWASVENAASPTLSSTQDAYVFQPEPRVYSLAADAGPGTSLWANLTLINHFSASTAYTATVSLAVPGCGTQAWCASFAPAFDGEPASYSTC